MNYKIAWLLVFACFTSSFLTANPKTNKQDPITVYIFLHEFCLISQYYTLPLRELHETYANEQVQFVGLFPSPSSKPELIAEFKADYQIPFELKADHRHEKKEALGATVTPEVIVYNEHTGVILYQGRIDDAYARVGQRKRVTTTSELKDALEAIQNGQPIPVAKTQAIGCYISDNKLDR